MILGLLPLVMAGLAGCATGSASPAAVARPATRAAGSPAAIRLEATLLTPTDIGLRWHDDDRTVAGHVVEFATAPDGPFTILQFVAPGSTTYTHAELMPNTPFYYRVRPYYGPASSPIEVRLPAGGFDDAARGSDPNWATPRVVPHSGAPAHAVRGTDSAAAAPTGLTASIVNANGIRFTWTDHASDEEGYLLEDEPAGRTGYRVIAVFDRDVDAVGLVTLADEKRASYRVRPFAYGAASNLAHRTTGS